MIWAGVEWVDNEIFRETFLTSGLTITTLGRRVGIEGHTLKRMLGLRESQSKGPRPWHNRQGRVRYDVAVKLCDALDISYHEAGV